MLTNYILFLIYSAYFWTILSTIRVCYNKTKVGFSIVPYPKLIPFTIYHTFILIVQLFYILPLSYFMTKYNYQVFVCKQLSWNFKLLFPQWWGNIKWYGLKNIPTYNCIFMGNHESILDIAIMTMLPCKTPMITISKDNYLIGSEILELYGISSINFQKKFKEVLNNGMSVNIFQDNNRNINRDINREAFDIARDTNVPIIPYSINYKRMNISVRFHKPIYVNNSNYTLNL